VLSVAERANSTISRTQSFAWAKRITPVRRSGSIARRNARSRAVVRTRSVSPPILSSLLGNTAAMAIARCRTAAPGGLDNQRQTGRAYLATRGAEGPPKQPKRSRLWLADGSCIRLWPEQRNHDAKDLSTPEWQACIASLLQGQRDERLSSRAPW